MSKHYFDPRLKIFALNSNRPLAEKIAAAVGVELGKSSVTQFSDGEIQVNIEEVFVDRMSMLFNQRAAQSMIT